MNTSRRDFISTSATLAAAALAPDVESRIGVAEKQQPADLDIMDPNFKSSFGRSFASDAVHAGENSNCAATPIYMGSTNNDGVYTRDHNPTSDEFEEKLKDIEGGNCAISTACGMAAISQTLFTFLKLGARIVRHRCVYPGTYWLLTEDFPKYGVDCVLIDMRDLSQLRDALKKKTDIVYFEVHSNPNLDVIDVKAVIEIAHQAGAMVIIDNTFLSPYLIQPLRMGADIVLHSATKYISGHGMGLGGIIVTAKKETGEQIKHTRVKLGGVISPMNAFLFLHGIKTLPMRMKRHCENAMRLAEFLETHSKVEKVHYPGLSSDPGHTVAKKQLKGFGGMLGFTFKIKRDISECTKFTRYFKMCKPWGSLGDTSTLVFITGEHKDLAIPGSYIRISTGIEDVEDIIGDFKQALDKA